QRRHADTSEKVQHPSRHPRSFPLPPLTVNTGNSRESCRRERWSDPGSLSQALGMKNNKSRVNPEGQYSIGSASELLGLSPSTVRDLERRGQIECIRTPGGQRRISGAEILRLLEAASVHHGKQASAGDAKPRPQH